MEATEKNSASMLLRNRGLCSTADTEQQQANPKKAARAQVNSSGRTRGSMICCCTWFTVVWHSTSPSSGLTGCSR